MGSHRYQVSQAQPPSRICEPHQRPRGRASQVCCVANGLPSMVATSLRCAKAKHSSIQHRPLEEALHHCRASAQAWAHHCSSDVAVDPQHAHQRRRHRQDACHVPNAASVSSLAALWPDARFPHGSSGDRQMPRMWALLSPLESYILQPWTLIALSTSELPAWSLP